MQPSLLDDASKTIFAVTSKESKFTAPYKQGDGGSPTNATIASQPLYMDRERGG